MLIKNIPLSICSIPEMNFRHVSKCYSLYTISAQHAPITAYDDNPYPDPLEYECSDISIKSLKYNINITRNLESCTNSY